MFAPNFTSFEGSWGLRKGRKCLLIVTAVNAGHSTVSRNDINHAMRMGLWSKQESATILEVNFQILYPQTHTSQQRFFVRVIGCYSQRFSPTSAALYQVTKKRRRKIAEFNHYNWVEIFHGFLFLFLSGFALAEWSAKQLVLFRGLLFFFSFSNFALAEESSSIEKWLRKP